MVRKKWSTARTCGANRPKSTNTPSTTPKPMETDNTTDKLTDMDRITGKPVDEDYEVPETASEGSVSDYVASGRKRIPLASLNTAKKRRFAEHSLLENTPALTVQTPASKPALPHSLRLTSSNETPNLNRWLEAVNSLSVKREVVPNGVGIEHRELLPLAQFPDMPARDYKASIESADVQVNYDPQPGDAEHRSMKAWAVTRDAVDGYLKTIKTWRIRVWNAAVPETETRLLRLFPEWKPTKTNFWQGAEGRQHDKSTPIDEKYKYWSVGGPLDANVCPDETAATQIANEACRLLNKYPGTIDHTEFPEEAVWNDHLPPHVFRHLIELQSLRVLQDDLDFPGLRCIFKSSKMRGGAYCLTPSITAYNCLRSHSKTQAASWRLRVPIFTLDSHSEWHMINIFEDQLDKECIRALPDVPKSWAFNPTMPKTLPSGSRKPKSMLKLIRFVCWKYFGCVGTKAAVQNAPKNVTILTRERKILMGPFEGDPLFKVWMARGEISPSNTVAKTIQGAIPAARTTLPMAGLAMALESASKKFEQNKGILAAFEELNVALDELALNKSILTKADHCKCGSIAELEKTDKTNMRNFTTHFCMICCQAEVCSRMARTSDDRLVCLLHFVEGPPPPDKLIEGRILQTIQGAERGVLSQRLRDRMFKVATKQLLPGSGFRDVYSGDRPEGMVNTRGLRVTVDALFPVWKDGSSFYVHHPDNIGLTTQFANYLCGSDIPVVLPLAGKAVRAKEKGEPVKDIERAFDHCMKVRDVFPLGREARKTAALIKSDAWFSQYLEMMRTGIYDDTFTPLHKGRALYVTRAYTWDTETILRLNLIIEEMESSEELNPGKKLKLPRAKTSLPGIPAAPWLWNTEHMFQDHDWQFLGEQYSHRFERMDVDCDFANDHSHESDQNLFLAHAVQWFKTEGGKDEMLGLRTTVFSRHPLRYSVGRALNVAPGSAMVTGWTKKFPDCLADYDASRCTITFETWMMNRAKRDFTPDPDAIESWFGIIRSFPEVWDTRLWNNRIFTEKLDRINWPKLWSAHSTETENIDEESDEERNKISYDEDNEGLRAEGVVADIIKSVKAPKPTRSQAAIDTALFEMVAQYVPPELLQHYTDATKRYHTGKTFAVYEETTDFDERLRSFQWLVEALVKDFKFDTFFKIQFIEDLPLSELQGVVEDLEHPFTADEVISYCLLLHGKGELTYLPEDNGFIFELAEEVQSDVEEEEVFTLKNKGKGRALS